MWIPSEELGSAFRTSAEFLRVMTSRPPSSSAWGRTIWAAICGDCSIRRSCGRCSGRGPPASMAGTFFCGEPSGPVPSSGRSWLASSATPHKQAMKWGFMPGTITPGRLTSTEWTPMPFASRWTGEPKCFPDSWAIRRRAQPSPAGSAMTSSWRRRPGLSFATTATAGATVSFGLSWRDESCRSLRFL